MGRDDVVHAVGENRRVLQLRPQHLFREDGVRMREDAAEVGADEPAGDAVPEPAGRYGAAVDCEVSAGLEAAFVDQVPRTALERTHAGEDLGDEQGDVVVDAHLRTDVARGGEKDIVAGQDQRDERGVQVDDRGKCVEGQLGQRALGARARGGGRLSGHRADEFHEKLGQLQVVDRVEDAERAHAGLRRVVAPPGDHEVHRRERRGAARGELAPQALAEVGQRGAVRIREVGTELQVARVLRGLAIDQPWVGGGDKVVRPRTVCRGGPDQLLHRRGEGGEPNRIFHQ